MAGWLLALLAAAVLLAWKFPRLRRWFRGHPLDGRLRTNATWNRPATKVLHPTGHALFWHHWRQRELAAVRVSLTVFGLAVAVGLVVNRAATLLILAGGILLLAGLRLPAGVARGRAWQHHRTWVRPTRLALTYEMGVPPVRLEIAPDRSRVVVGLPVEFTGSPGERQAITRAVAEKLAIPGHDAAWSLNHENGKKPQVTYTKNEDSMPSKVSLADVLHPAEACDPDELLAGLGIRGESVVTSLEDDACHLALSIGPGGGKTTAAKWIGAQILHKGGLLVVLNAKRIGYSWTKGLPNAAQAKELEDIGEMILWLNGERIRREKVADLAVDIEDEIHADVGARILIIFEEMNLTMPKLKKVMPEAAEAFGDLGFAGRQSRMHLLPIAQRYSAKAAGGGDIRAAVGTRIIGRFDKGAWNMLAASFVMPPMNNNPGRVQVVTSEVQECQMPRLTGQQAHDYALSGPVARCPADMPFRCATALSVVPGTPQIEGPDLPSVLRQAPLAAPYQPDALALSEAVAGGIFGTLSLEAVRRRSTRDPLFPEPVNTGGKANLYSEDDLYEYVARKAIR